MTLVTIGALMLAGAAGLGITMLVGASGPRLSRERIAGTVAAPGPQRSALSGVDRPGRHGGRQGHAQPRLGPVHAAELELAGVEMSAASLVVMISSTTDHRVCRRVSRHRERVGRTRPRRERSIARPAGAASPPLAPAPALRKSAARGAADDGVGDARGPQLHPRPRRRLARCRATHVGGARAGRQRAPTGARHRRGARERRDPDGLERLHVGVAGDQCAARDRRQPQRGA